MILNQPEVDQLALVLLQRDDGFVIVNGDTRLIRAVTSLTTETRLLFNAG